MYLVQSYRLKHKLLPRPGFRLPSLEWLQMVNKQTLYLSAILVAVGLFAGVVLNVLRKQSGISWTDPLIVSSGGLLAWLFAATLFELLYKPAQQGRKVAYLTIVNFVFLAAVLAIVLFGESKHAVGAREQGSRGAGELTGSAPPLLRSSAPPLLAEGVA
jgi:CDP-diglyceride synthetase